MEKKEEKALVEKVEKKNENALVLQKSWLSKNQLLKMLQKTPKSHVYTRPGKGGGSFEYVTGVYVKKILNWVAGWNWDFIIEDKQMYGLAEGTGQVIIQGRLVIHDPSGKKSIVKTQFGRADIKYRKGTKTPVDLGNDFKAAATDCLKKCASELGIASDVYGAQEFREIKMETEEKSVEMISSETIDAIEKTCKEGKISVASVLKKLKVDSLASLTEKQGKSVLIQLEYNKK